MATADGVKDKIRRLINTANATTGKTDVTLTTAVNSLVEGFGQGGGSNDLLHAILTGTLKELSLGPDYPQIKEYAFAAQKVLESVDFSHVTHIYGHAFQDCTALKSVTIDHSTNGGLGPGGDAFNGCKALESFEYLGEGIFHYVRVLLGCSALREVNIPFVTSLQNDTFSGCSSLEQVCFPSLQKIGSTCFKGCVSLEKLALPHTDVVTLTSVNALLNTPFDAGGTGGTVYVPEVLIESYQTAANWSALYAAGTCNFVAIEESEFA